ncbi:hypothetical protein AB5I41_09845 [Sphingomonas sp. MMS24-JH45]
MKAPLSINDLQTISDIRLRSYRHSSMALSPIVDKALDVSGEVGMSLPGLFSLVFIAALVGIVWPYQKLRRWHFAVTAFASFIGVGATVPPPTAEQLAAKEREKKKEAAKAAETAAKKVQDEQSEHDKVSAKGTAALAGLTPYKKGDNNQTYRRLGASTFAKLEHLEPGAVYAAAESRACDQVATATLCENALRAATHCGPWTARMATAS